MQQATIRQENEQPPSLLPLDSSTGSSAEQPKKGRKGKAFQAFAITQTKDALDQMRHSSLCYAANFFGWMVVMDLALEGATQKFPDLDALPWAITLFQFGCCFLLPILLSHGAALSSFPKTGRECIPYISLSIAVLGSTSLSYVAVWYVSYPTKVVFKCAKLIPTMLIATMLHQETQYTALDYLAALLLCAGAVGYSWGGGSSALQEKDGGPSKSYIGVSLLLVSICCDSFIPNIQQRLMGPPRTALPSQTAGKQQSSSFLRTVSSLFLPTHGGGLGLSAATLMTNVNGIGWCGILLFMTLTGSLFDVITAARAHPLLLVYLTGIGISLAMAVFSYTRLIQKSGSVVAVGVATIRKVVTVILSYVVYPKALSRIHVVSGIVVLGGMLLSNHSKQRSKAKKLHT